MRRGSLLIATLAGLGSLVAVLVPTDVGAVVRGGDSPVKDGGTLAVGVPAFDFIDPALTPSPNSSVDQGVFTTSWAVADATCALLFRYPLAAPPEVRYDLVPEVAADYPAVSRNGRTYTFTIRSGFKFSTGAPVTAENYASAIERDLNPAMHSPAAEYLQDIAGVRATGNRLIVRLRKKVPDLTARMTMPYLCPVPTDLSIAPEGVTALPGSGPYYVSDFVRGKQVVLKRNPFYRGPRPHHVDQLTIQVLADSEVISRQVEAGALDVDNGVPLSRLSELYAKYSINKTRLFAVPSGNIFYLHMNTSRPLFKNNVELRQAVNFALDRTQMLFDFGPYWSGTVTDDYLPPGLPGYVDAHLYPLEHPNFTKARALARGHTRSGKAVMYTCDNIITSCLAHAQTVQQDLKAIGIDVEIKQFPFTVGSAKVGTRGEPFDLSVERYSVAWVDPYQYVNVQLDGRTIEETGNTDRSYFNSPHYNRLIDQVGSLSGRARYAAYGRLSVDLARNAAPLATMFVRNNRFFVSSRVGCVRVGAHGLDLAGLCLK
jgi:ABC-type transport system substrate-binding protein